MTNLRRALYELALGHLQNRCPTNIHEQGEASLLLNWLIQQDIKDDNGCLLVNFGEVVMRKSYVDPLYVSPLKIQEENSEKLFKKFGGKK